MESNSPYQQKPIQEEGFDLKALLFKYLKNWYWFVISVIICAAIAIIYVSTATPVYESTASFSVRPDRVASLYSQLAVVEGYGYLNNKSVEDETSAIKSPYLLYKAVSDLDIESTYYRKAGMKYEDIYKGSPIQLILPANYRENVKTTSEFKIKKTQNGYNISIHIEDFKVDHTVKDLDEPTSTPFGEIRFAELWDMGMSTYKIINKPIGLLLQAYSKKLKISHEGNRSSVINIKLETSSSQRSSDIVNKLIETYYSEALKDKNEAALNTINLIDERLKAVNKELLEIESKIEILNKRGRSTEKEQEVLEMKRLYQAKERNYSFLMDKREENELLLVTDLSESKAIKPASTPLNPVSPRRLVILCIGILIGCLIPLIIIYIMDFFNTKIENKKQIQSKSQVPFLGSVTTKKLSGKLYSEKENADSFEKLRTSLQYETGIKQSPVILITSNKDGEGKTFTATNLAQSFASIHKKTVLLDIDTTRGRSDLSTDSTEGISNYIVNNDLRPEDIILTTEDNPFLSVIPAGKFNSNTADLIRSNRLDELIAELKKTFDYIIIDSAAVNNTPDTYQLNRIVDLTLFVVRQNFTKSETLYSIDNLYISGKLNNMFLVLNDTEKS